MIDNLTQKDWYLAGAGVVLSIIATVLTQIGVIGPAFEMVLTFVMVIPIIPGLYFLYKSRSLWGGDMARYLDFIGVGLVINLVLFPVHMGWHFGLVASEAGAAMLGLSPNFWYIFFHGLTGYSFAMLAYGFYLFYKSGAE